MYTPKGEFAEVYSLFVGYSLASTGSPISNDKWNAFNEYVCIKFGFPTKYVASYVFNSCTRSDKSAIELFKNTLIEFVEESEKRPLDELLKIVRHESTSKEGEPEIIFRLFSDALLEGKEEVIKNLIEEHENQSVLWEGKYLNKNAELLKMSSKEQPIKRLYESEDKTKIKLITSDYPFPIEVNLKNGNWKIDASPIIAIRMRNR